MTPRFRVQTRTHGEPWRTKHTEGDLAVAEHRAAQLAEQRDLGGFAIWPYVRVQYADEVLVLWQYGRLVLAPKAVAS